MQLQPSPSKTPPAGAAPTSSGNHPDPAFIAPNASPQAQQFIVKGRQMMMDPRMAPAVRSALGGTQDIAQGIATFVVQMVAKLQEKMGDLPPQDVQVVVAHLVGTMVLMAQHLKEPSATQDPKGTTQRAIQIAIQMLQGQQGDPSQVQSQQPDPSMPPQGAQAPMGQFAGAPQ